jgi:hypothetical protein
MLVLLVVISSLFVYVVANITEKRTASTLISVTILEAVRFSETSVGI